MRVIDYDPSRRADIADLMARVWGKRPGERELEWFYEHNPVRPASVVLGEEDGRVVGTMAISFQRMALGGANVEVGTAVHIATDPGYRGRGVFSTLEAACEERARALGVPLLLCASNAESTRVLVGKLGWRALPPVRVWARLGRRAAVDIGPSAASGDRVLRDAAWLRWRFEQAPFPYTVIATGGYAVAGRRGRLATIAVVEGAGLGEAIRATRGLVVIAAPPPRERMRYLAAGFLPSPRTLTLLAKPLVEGGRLPEHVHLELGDLDFL